MRVGFLTAVLTASVLSRAAHAAIVEEFKAEDWDGTAFTADATGQFSHCAVYASYRNGSTLYISYEASEGWYLSVSNDSWSLTEGGNYAIKFKVDRRGEVEGTGGALATNQIGLPVEADHPFIGQLRRGNQLTISFQNQDYFFELSNSNKAMDAAQDCVRRHVAADTRTPVMSRKPEEQAAAPDPSPEPAPAPGSEDNASADTSDGSAAVAAGDEQTFGPWVVSATEDGSGAFVNCTAYGTHGDDQLILSYFSDDVWTFGLYRPAWSLDTNQTYYLWYNVDGPADAEGVIKRPVEAAEPTRIFFEISDLEDIIEKMESGTTLNIQFRGLTGDAENHSYPLEQTADAFAAARQCVSDHAPSSETVSKDGTGTKESETSTAQEEETARSDDATESHQELPALGMTLVEEFDVPGWKAAAFSLDDGTFTHCGIKAEYQNGATLGVARTAGGNYLLAIQHGDWTFDPNTWVPISYSVVGGTSLSAAQDGQAVEANVILAVMGGEELTGTLKTATEMTIDAEGKTLSFDVSDVGPGIEAIDECVGRHASDTEAPATAAPAAKKAGATPAPEPETDVASPAVESAEPAQDPDALPSRGDDVASADTPAATMDARTEAGGFTTALLFRSGYPNHVILGADAAAPDEVPPGDAAWELGDVIGSTRIVSAGTPSAIERDIGPSMADKCDGSLTSKPVTSDATHSQFTLVCDGMAPWTTQFVVVPRDGGGSYLFAMNGKGDDIAEELTATALYNTALGG